MNVNTSTNVYSYAQDTSGNASKKTSSQPATGSSTTTAQSNSSAQSTISGLGLMMTRLYGNTNALPVVQTQLTTETQDMDAVNFLTLDDRNVLSDLYAQAKDQGTDLLYVDDLARDLGKYRKFGSVSGNYNTGNTYDVSGRKQTIDFTAKDSGTASRILNSGNLSSSVLDPGFLKFELNSGYSFDHVANFDYLESVVNNSASKTTSNGLSRTPDFTTYVSQGQNNYVVNTASEVTFKTDEPDVISKDGVFYVTETGKKHGFRLEGNNVLQDQDKGLSISDIQSQIATTLLDYYVNANKSENVNTDKPTSLFDYLFSSNIDKKIQK
ncbi:hypothetical protein [Lonsdalea quercina]|uniref:hypothetical protein n=1 Tax=Lonsdalea quercina TaxID=71657 RepID=UPI003975DF63